MEDFDCKYCHGDQGVAEIAIRMGFRPDIAFVYVRKAERRVEELEFAMQEFVERCEKGEVKSRYTYQRFKQLLSKKEKHE